MMNVQGMLTELVELLTVADTIEPMPCDNVQEAIARVRENIAAALLIGRALLANESAVQEMFAAEGEPTDAELDALFADDSSVSQSPCANCGSKTGDGCGECSAAFCAAAQQAPNEWTAEEILRNEG